MKMKLPFLFLLLAAQLSFGQSVNTKERSTAKIAENVYVIRHPDAPDEFPQGNTTVIIGDREVLVIDACYLPSSAREDIEQIRKWTDKPVRYLVNTHWHYDHTMGNGVYAEAFPSLTIVAHTETQRQIEGYNPGWFARYTKNTAKMRAQLESGKEEDGKPLTEARKTELQNTVRNRDLVDAEFKKLVDRAPNLAFDSELTFDLGNRKVQLQHLGRGNTAGDIIAWLPAEKILVAGDLLDYPVPYLGGGYPSEQIGTLQRLTEFDARIIVPGHGELLRDKTHLHNVLAFITAVVDQVNAAIYPLGNSSRNLDDVQKIVLETLDLPHWRKLFFAETDKNNRDFFDSFSLPGIIRAAYSESWRK